MLGTRLVDWLWPARCAGCGTSGEWWCPKCADTVVTISAPGCPLCGKLTDRGSCCPRCRPKTALTGLAAGARLRGPLWAALKALKYRHAKVLAPILAEYLVAASAFLPGGCRVIVVVPLHRKRESARGHNQAELIARHFVSRTGAQLQPGLGRVTNTQPQTGLSRGRRRENLAGAFTWRGDSLRGKTVWLIDDVFTTGATLDACARACRSAGARQVWGLVVAKR